MGVTGTSICSLLLSVWSSTSQPNVCCSPDPTPRPPLPPPPFNCAVLLLCRHDGRRRARLAGTQGRPAPGARQHPAPAGRQPAARQPAAHVLRARDPEAGQRERGPFIVAVSLWMGGWLASCFIELPQAHGHIKWLTAQGLQVTGPCERAPCLARRRRRCGTGWWSG